MIIYVLKKHEIFLKTMKIVEFFLIIWGKLSELEPEPQFLTSWSRIKMDRLRNTARTGTSFSHKKASKILFYNNGTFILKPFYKIA
jgi:hypothetical protein